MTSFVANAPGIALILGAGVARLNLDTRAVVHISPNRAVRDMGFGVDLSRGGAPLTGATVVARFAMLDMDMGQQAYKLREVGPGTYRRNALALYMVGNWGLTFEVTPPIVVESSSAFAVAAPSAVLSKMHHTSAVRAELARVFARPARYPSA